MTATYFSQLEYGNTMIQLLDWDSRGSWCFWNANDCYFRTVGCKFVGKTTLVKVSIFSKKEYYLFHLFWTTKDEKNVV